jgi:outer membrane protein OmpA-like peptidoglycan-associated protein
MRHGPATVLLLVALGACTTPRAPAPEHAATPAPPPTPDQRAAVPANVAVERQWLTSWFKGTPVRIRQIDDSAIEIDVPREFCFDAGKSAVKPALGAVIDKMTQSLQRMPLANVTLIAAPGDAQANADLALKRAAQVHERLRAAGVRADRLGKPSVAGAPAVQLRMEASPL